MSTNILNPSKGGFDYYEPLVFPRVKRTGQVATGPIEPGERVRVVGRDGAWRVIAFHRDGAHLVSVTALNRTELHGIDRKRLVRAS